jgi:hypothetical protein
MRPGRARKRLSRLPQQFRSGQTDVLQDVIIQFTKMARQATHPRSFPPESEQVEGLSERRLALRELCSVSRWPDHNTSQDRRRLRYHSGSPNDVFCELQKIWRRDFRRQDIMMSRCREKVTALCDGLAGDIGDEGVTPENCRQKTLGRAVQRHHRARFRADQAGSTKNYLIRNLPLQACDQSRSAGRPCRASNLSGHSEQIEGCSVCRTVTALKDHREPFAGRIRLTAEGRSERMQRSFTRIGLDAR